ncbi:MAG: hypothetical protein H0W62_10920 [Chitinophagales bacterium]|nr:hypothetical protein [Chitinophagales bacterium]
MKFLALIFACFTLALSFAPCCDSNVGLANIPQTIQQSQEQHHQDNELCSPFCQCNCCHGFVVIAHFRTSNTLPAFTQKHFTLYTERFICGIPDSHWQPPRLS